MPPQYAWYLQQARATVEQFKTAELREYFGDECVDAARPSTTALERVAPDAAIVYPILLPDRTELLVSLPTGLQARERSPSPAPSWSSGSRSFAMPWRSGTHSAISSTRKQLYAWLIQPLEADLAARHIQTLVFVPDGALRLLPLAALHDGQRFLIEKYALAITPSLTLTEPRPLSRDKVQVLAAGMARCRGRVSALAPGAGGAPGPAAALWRDRLARPGFGPERLDTTLRQGPFGIVHIAAHGHFAPDAAQSFLLTAQGKLTHGAVWRRSWAACGFGTSRLNS